MTDSSSSTQAAACAACKFQRRKCSPDCPLAPYFPADQPKQFLNVHKLYGVSNTIRILKQVDQCKRDDAIKSILYEADARDRDPVHGCFGIIALLQSQADMLREELEFVRTQVVHLMEQQQQQASAGYYPNPQLLSFGPIALSTTTCDQNPHAGSSAINPSSSWQLQQQQPQANFAGTFSAPSWLYQYNMASPHSMQAQMCAGSSARPLSSCTTSTGVISTPPVAAGFDLQMQPSFDSRSVMDYDQHFFHDSTPKAELYIMHEPSSSAESSIKDQQSLEHDELESAAALFTLTSGPTAA